MGSFVIRFGRETSFFGGLGGERRRRRRRVVVHSSNSRRANQSRLPPRSMGGGRGGLQAEEGPQLPAHLSFFLFPTSLPSHPHLQQHLSLIFLFYFYYLFRLCFFPLHRSALLTPPTSLFPWHICNPERRRRKRRRRERKGAARKNGCHCSALMVFCV